MQIGMAQARENLDGAAGQPFGFLSIMSLT
jgi:hypothetical protein